MKLSSQTLLRGMLFIALVISCLTSQGAGLKIENLRCEYQTNPLGIDAPNPVLGWILESKERNQSQTAYEVLASSSSAKLAKDDADLWDSGKVASAESVNIPYAGKSLHSGEQVWWKVRVWDVAGHVSEFSKPASFEMGLLQPSDWQAKWIQRASPGKIPDAKAFDDHPAPLFRKEFALDKKIVRARAYVSGLGYYELHLNGAKVGDHVLDPGWTTYSKRALYSTYDVTAQLKRGQNTIGIMLGNGWFNPLPLAMWGHIKPGDAIMTREPRAIVQLVVDFSDGTSQTIVSDTTWRVGDGPILRNSVYLGEVYDARHEQPNWDRAGFDDSSWMPVGMADEQKLGPLWAQTAPPIRITRTLRPVKLTEPRQGTYIFDLGQNFAGWAQLRAKGAAGTRVRLRYGELLYPDGTLNGMTSVAGQIKGGGKDYHYDDVGSPKTAFQIDEYVLKGDGTEVFTPHFTFHGFRYIEVTGFPGKPDLDSILGLRLNADVTPSGSFKCSNELFNKIQDLVLWTELSNVFSVQSDCPHREKFGYGGDIVASSEMGMLNFDMSQFYAKSAQDLADAVRPNGGFTETSPFVGISDEGLGGQSGPVDWGTAEPLLLCQLRQYYGETRPMAEQYEATKKWITLLQASATNSILDNGISDHESLVPKPRALTGTAFYYFNVKLFAQIARALGKQDDATVAESLAEKIQSAFNQKFLQPGTGRYDSASQACEAFALYHNLVPAEERPRALDALVHDITVHGGHLTTGIFGTKYMLNALTDSGRADVAYNLVNQRTFPGWGNMVEHGATTLWEHWELSDNVYSHNHPMFGSVSEWFYKGLAGIKPAPDAVGFDKIIIAPQPVGDLKWVKASYDSVHGKIVSDWSREADVFKLHVRVPVGAEATVIIPAREISDVAESGKAIQQGDGVHVLSCTDGKASLAVGSGDYYFTSRAE